MRSALQLLWHLIIKGNFSILHCSQLPYMDTQNTWTNAFLDQKRQVADPLADQAIGQLVDEKGIQEARKIFDLLIRNIEMPVSELPEAVRPFLEKTNQLPDWADLDAVETAHDLFLDHGPKFLVLLYYKSLPLLYTDAKGTKVLVKTSRLTNKDRSLRIFARRIAETGQFLVDVMTQGALQKGAKGVAAIQKVRLVHAAIRNFIQTDEWDEQNWGLPINQEDMALTLMTFSIALIDGLQQFNIEESPERLEAYLQTWIAIGHTLGVNKDLLPQNLAESRVLLETILQRQAAPSEEGELLTRSLLEFAENMMPTRELKIAPTGMIQHLIGVEKAKMLGIQPNYGCIAFLMPELLKSYFRFGEKLEDKISGPLDEFIDYFSRKLTRSLINRFDQYKGRNFEIPPQMKEKWL